MFEIFTSTVLRMKFSDTAAPRLKSPAYVPPAVTTRICEVMGNGSGTVAVPTSTSVVLDGSAGARKPPVRIRSRSALTVESSI